MKAGVWLDDYTKDNKISKTTELVSIEDDYVPHLTYDDDSWAIWSKSAVLLEYRLT